MPPLYPNLSVKILISSATVVALACAFSVSHSMCTLNGGFHHGHFLIVPIVLTFPGLVFLYFAVSLYKGKLCLFMDTWYALVRWYLTEFVSGRVAMCRSALCLTFSSSR